VANGAGPGDLDGRYDVIVVGAGSAGAVVAARASEDPGRSVLLLDAGPDYSRLAETPFDLVNAYGTRWRITTGGTSTSRRRSFR